MSLNYKIKKYQSKIQSGGVGTKEKDFYEEKLNKYLALRTLCDSLNENKKPKPIKTNVLSNYSFKNAINEKNSIVTIGYGCMDKGKPLEPVIFARKMTREDEVIIKIKYTGICHSDWHGIVGEWEAEFPLVPGHEIVGEVVEIGSAVKKFKIGDNVMVGPTIDSCGRCERCKQKYEQYCVNDSTEIYGGKERKPNDIKPSGDPTYGGYSNNVVIREYFVHKLPENLEISRCAPLMCAGATTYSPLKQMGVNDKFVVGIVGIGGLGHMAVKFAKAMGAKVIAITHTKNKVNDIWKLGADDVIYSDDFQQMEKYQYSLDAILSTIPFAHDVNPYTKLLKFKGILWIVGALMPMSIDPSSFFFYNTKMGSSWLAGSREIEEMLKLCSEKNIMPDVEIINIKDINSTREKMISGEVRYRYVIDMSTLG